MKAKSIIPDTFKGYTEADAMALVNIRSPELGEGLEAQLEADRIGDELGSVIDSVRIYEALKPWKRPVPRPDQLKQIQRLAARLLKLLNVDLDGKPNAEPNIRQQLLMAGTKWAYRWVSFHEAMERQGLTQSVHEQRLSPSDREKLRGERKARALRATAEKLRQHRQHGEWPTTKYHVWEIQADGSERLILGENEALRSAIQGIQRLRTWSSVAAGHLKKKPYPKVEQDRKRLPRIVLLERLILSYDRLFGEGAFGIVTYNYGENESTTGGKHVEFIQRAMAPLGITMNAPAIAKAFNKMPKRKEQPLYNRAAP